MTTTTRKRKTTISLMQIVVVMSLRMTFEICCPERERYIEKEKLVK